MPRSLRALSEARAAAAPALARAVRERLAELGDGRRELRGRAARLRARPQRRRAGPVRDRAEPRCAGGAAARDRLWRRALARDARAAFGGARCVGASTLVFDEIDAGIGGHTARAVGEQLRALAAGPPDPRDHSPAAGRLGRRPPLHDREGPDRAEPARTRSTQLADGEVLGELVRMLGADERDAGARRHAKELLAAA